MRKANSDSGNTDQKVRRKIQTWMENYESLL